MDLLLTECFKGEEYIFRDARKKEGISECLLFQNIDFYMYFDVD
jgi:hypothetical protein